MCMCIPNMKFLCLILCQGEVCTDNSANANKDDDGQFMIVQGTLVAELNEPKNKIVDKLVEPDPKRWLEATIYS